MIHLWQQQRLEVLSYDAYNGEYITVRVAIRGVPAVSMDIHKSIRDACPTEDDWLDYLAQSADTMIQLYGDAREGRDLLPAPPEMAAAGV